MLLRIGLSDDIEFRLRYSYGWTFIDEAEDELTCFVPVDWLRRASERELWGREKVALWNCVTYALWRRR